MHEVHPVSAGLRKQEGNFEMRGFAQLMPDGRWAPRASVIEHRNADGLTLDTNLELVNAPTFATENEAAGYGLGRAIAFAGEPSKLQPNSTLPIRTR